MSGSDTRMLTLGYKVGWEHTWEQTISAMPSKICDCVMSADALPWPDSTLERPTAQMPTCMTSLALALQPSACYWVESQEKKILHRVASIESIIRYYTGLPRDQQWGGMQLAAMAKEFRAG